MENYSIVIFILAVMIGLSAIADKVKLPYPILLIVAGIGVGFIPAVPNIALNPEIVFLIFYRRCFMMLLLISPTKLLKPTSALSAPWLYHWYLLRHRALRL